MTDQRWTRDDVQRFADKLGSFYAELSDTEKQIFADMLEDGVRDTDDVAGYVQSADVVPTAAVTTAVTDFLLARAEA